MVRALIRSLTGWAQVGDCGLFEWKKLRGGDAIYEREGAESSPRRRRCEVGNALSERGDFFTFEWCFHEKRKSQCLWLRSVSFNYVLFFEGQISKKTWMIEQSFC